MEEQFKNCGHPRSGENIYWMYGAARCLTCKRARAREYMARRRREWIEQYGSGAAMPDNENEAA